MELSRNLDEADYQDTDSDGVRELPDGSPMDVKIALQSGNETYQRIAEILTNHLAEVGIRVSVDVETISKSDYTNQLRNDGVYEIYIGQTTTGCAQWTGVVNYVADIMSNKKWGPMGIRTILRRTMGCFTLPLMKGNGQQFDTIASPPLPARAGGGGACSRNSTFFSLHPPGGLAKDRVMR